MAARDVLKNINLFVDGKGMAGQIEEINPPKLTQKMEDFRAGGMDTTTAIPMGMEKLEASWSMISYDMDVLALWGVSVGTIVPFTVRGALESFDGTVTPIIYNLRGRVRELDPGTVKPGEKSNLSVTVDLTYYKYTQGGRVVHEIDVENMVRIIDGTDVLAALRTALGI